MKKFVLLLILAVLVAISILLDLDFKPVLALHARGKTAQQLGQDNAGISARADQRSRGSGLCDSVERIVSELVQLGNGVFKRQRHIRTRIAVTILALA